MISTDGYDATTMSLALSKFAGVGPRLMEVLLHHYGNLEHILRADSKSLMAIEGMTADTATIIAGSAEFLQAAEEYRAQLVNRDILVKTRLDDDFPHGLLELNDPPPLLYVRGRMPDNAKKSIAIVGAANATNEGIELTVKMARAAAEAGVQTVSSLRKGIDATTHLGTRKAEGSSFAVLDSGLDHIHPLEYMPLTIDIVQAGGIISEYPPDRCHKPDAYKVSNRILAALPQAVVVTEIYKDSKQTLDLLSCCCQIGKMAFVLIDPVHGGLADQESLGKAVSYGAIPMVGFDKIDDILKSLV